MEKKINKWAKGKRVVISLLSVTAMLLTVVPGVHAEDSQSANATQTSEEEVVSPNIIRYEGRSRENVAERVASQQFKDSNKVIIVNRDKFPDAISATNISQGNYPVLYTRENRVSDSTIELLKSMSLDEIYVLGGELSISKDVVGQLYSETNVKVTRVAGRSRYDANVDAVEENFESAKHVVIASGEVYSDALYAVSYANTDNSPVVLTNTNRLEDSSLELLENLGVEKVTIIGGTLTVTELVEIQLEELEIEFNRIAGRNRYIGSAEVATESYKNPQSIVVASGEIFSDALVSAPLAQKLNAPILLVRSNRMETVVEDYLTDSRIGLENIYIQGGPLTILPDLENRINVLTSYEQSIRIVPVTTKNHDHDFETIVVDDDTLPEGEEKIDTPGEVGYETVYYEVVYIDGREFSRVEVDKKIVEPVDEVKRRGTLVTEDEPTDEDEPVNEDDSLGETGGEETD